MIPDNARRKWLEKYYPVPANKVSKSEALEHSIQKWRGLQLPVLKRHGLTVSDYAVRTADGRHVLEIDTGTCALCNHYYDHSRGCPDCPLTRKAIPELEGCIKAFGKFVRFGKAKPMLNALLRARRRQQRMRGG